VLVSWDAFERVDFSPGGTGPAYGEFPPGRPLAGRVATITGRHLAGRLVYDLDESETTETLDAPAEGVDYTIPFGLVASVVLGASGEDGVAGRGDLGEANAGLLVFTGAGERPEYVPWPEVGRVTFDRPPAMYPPLGGQATPPAGEAPGS
jgi:hypothetical protein